VITAPEAVFWPRQRHHICLPGAPSSGDYLYATSARRVVHSITAAGNERRRSRSDVGQEADLKQMNSHTIETYGARHPVQQRGSTRTRHRVRDVDFITQ